jgi:spore germination protein KA
MFRYIAKKLQLLFKMKWEPQAESEKQEQEPQAEEVSKSSLSENLEENLKALEDEAGSSDLVIRRFVFGRQARAAIVYVDGLTDKTLVNEDILKPLMRINITGERALASSADIDYVKDALLFVGDIDTEDTLDEAIGDILSGDTVFFMDGAQKAMVISLKGWKTRGIDEPLTESVVRGPREGFTETLRINTSMLRRKIKNPDLKFEMMKIGRRTRTDVCIVYIKDLAKPELIDEIRQRLGRIKTDAILESGYVEQYIEDAPESIFPTIANSEKPDRVAAKLLEGRAALLVDGTPFVLTVPMVFIESFQSAEDYYSRPFYASLIRILRFVSFLISILAPAMYVALSAFHQELIPTPLLLSMASAHEGVPFPAVMEAALMLLFFEILREAGVRLPRPVGQAVSIVGALVIGQAAVSAGLIGAPMVIVVAITAISSFVVPAQADAESLIRFALLILSGFLGGFGIGIGLFAMLIYLASLRSFGTPYLMPVAPYSRSGMKDTFIRAPLWNMARRPRGMAQDVIRQDGPSCKPSPLNTGQTKSDGAAGKEST